MEMSYRRAWLLIDQMNHLFEEPVIETKHGGSGGVVPSSLRCRGRSPHQGFDQSYAQSLIPQWQHKEEQRQ
jgi:molybdate transport repressor ModE-like protein